MYTSMALSIEPCFMIKITIANDFCHRL